MGSFAQRALDGVHVVQLVPVLSGLEIDVTGIPRCAHMNFRTVSVGPYIRFAPSNTRRTDTF